MAAAPVVFDYDLSKVKYMENVKKCFDESSSHSEYTIRKTIEVLKGSEKTHLRKYYETSFAFGREVLIEKRKSPTEPEVQVLTFEDVFDIFIKFHIANNHNGGRQHLMIVEKQFLKTLYNYPSVCLSLVVKSCNVCISKTQKPVKTCIKIGSVFISLMVQNGSNTCKYLLIYIDKSTDFVVIRPLNLKHDVEIAMEIFKILMQFGPPQKLRMHGHNKDFNKKVASHLRQVCPKFNFSIEYRSANLEPSAYVVSKVMDWMSINDSQSWEIGCSVVQRELNMTCLETRTGEKMNITPFELQYYGKAMSNLMSKEEEAHPYLKSAQVLQMQFKRKVQNKADTISEIDNSEVIILDDDVVELSIPNTENYNLDLLSQFEDSEASQEHVEPTQADVMKLKVEEMVIDENDNKDEVMQHPKVMGLCEVIDDKVPSLDLEVDDDRPEEKEEIEPNIAEKEDQFEPDDLEDFGRRRSSRLVKKIVDSKVTEWIEEKRDEVAAESVLEINEDPLNVDGGDELI